MAYTRYFQIPFSAGYAIDGTSSHLIKHSAKIIEPSRLPNTRYNLEAVYRNTNAPDAKIEIYNPSLALIASLTLPQSTNADTLIRGADTFTLTADGPYRIKLYGAGVNTWLSMVRLGCAQSNFPRTVEHVQLATPMGRTYDDLSGIGGSEWMRGTDITYFPIMQLEAALPYPPRYSESSGSTNNLAWFYYKPSEWTGLVALQLEMMSDSFAISTYGALFKVSALSATQTMVPGSECHHIQGDDPPSAVLSGLIDPADMEEGYYAFRGKCGGGGGANGFWYNACLHMILESSAQVAKLEGNTYYIIGAPDETSFRNVPTWTDEIGSECCSWIEPGDFFGTPQGVVRDAGTSDTAAGSIIAGATVSFQDAIYEKTVKRSTDLSSLLTVGNRLLGSREGGSYRNRVLETLRAPFSFAVKCNFMLKADPVDLQSERRAFWEKTFDFYPDAPRDYEKSLYRLYLYYEDIGSSRVRVTGTSRRGITYPAQTIDVTNINDGKPKVAVFDIVVTDVLMKLVLEVICGQLSIIMAVCELEPGGVLAKNT